MLVSIPERQNPFCFLSVQDSWVCLSSDGLQSTEAGHRHHLNHSWYWSPNRICDIIRLYNSVNSFKLLAGLWLEKISVFLTSPGSGVGTVILSLTMLCKAACEPEMKKGAELECLQLLGVLDRSPEQLLAVLEGGTNTTNCSCPKLVWKLERGSCFALAWGKSSRLE